MTRNSPRSAGEQRVLSQQIAKAALEASTVIEGRRMSNCRNTTTAFDETMNMLKNGNPALACHRPARMFSG